MGRPKRWSRYPTHIMQRMVTHYKYLNPAGISWGGGQRCLNRVHLQLVYSAC